MIRQETLLESGMIPDFLIRFFIRRRLSHKLKEAASGPEVKKEVLCAMSQGPLAVHTQAANEQHYEVPPGFFEAVLGARLKYSCGYWPAGVTSLDASEEAMLELYLERAQIKDGQEILELGCGWGSFSLYLAEKFPNSRILGVSNSNPQREWIQQKALERGLRNLEIRTADMNLFDPAKTFDRIVSIEMFEHMRNYRELLRRVSSWLKPEGKLFVHIFCHKTHAYFFEHSGPNDWMGKYFFTGGVMPSLDIFEHFPQDLRVIQRWTVDGTHYEKTSNLWLAKMDSEEESLRPLFQRVYGAEARRWWVYWRIFFMACAELFGYHEGQEWFVGHYLMERAEK